MVSRTFDRLKHFDPRSRNYGISDRLTTMYPRGYGWAAGVHLDQGTEGACVGFAFTGELAATPVRVPVSDGLARDVYHAAQQVDEWSGEDYEGTSVLAGAKVLKSHGYIEEYRWAFSLTEALAAISWEGPVVLGLNWYEGMTETDHKGFIHPSGRLLGGHAILARGVSTSRRYVRLRNSWGHDWGVNGDALITWDDLERLLAEDGECCVPVGRKKTSWTLGTPWT